jgi:hypothetical protein
MCGKNLLNKMGFFHVLIFIVSLLVIFSRRPDVLLNPQFWAEDGRVWYAEAYNQGAIYSLTTPQDGYFQTISRIGAVFSQMFPLACGPLVFNLIAISAKILVVSFIASSRFSKLIPNVYGRLLIGFIYLALPVAFETHGNLTNVQWHLALLSFLIIIAAPSDKLYWKIFDFTIILISALSGPFCILLLPIVVIKWLITKEKRSIYFIIILAAVSAIQIIPLLLTERPSRQPLGANIGLFFEIIGGHIFFSSIFGDNNYGHVFYRELWNAWIAAPMVLLGFSLLIFTFIKSNLELRLFLIFSGLIIAGALISPAASSEIPQWEALSTPITGSRYWMIPIFCCFVSMIYLAYNAEFSAVRYLSIGLLTLSLVGIISDWKYPRFEDLNFQKYAAEFKNVPAGQEVIIPINPGWEMRLIKKADANIENKE